MSKFQVSERTACGLVGLSRTAFRYMPLPRYDEGAFRAEVVRLACTYGRYGYRSIAAMMRNAGWQGATQQRVKRIWQQEGLKVPDKQVPKARLRLNDGGCLRLCAQCPNHVWSYDFVFVRDACGRKICMLTMIDEYTWVCL